MLLLSLAVRLLTLLEWSVREKLQGSGETLAATVRRHLFEPLGLTATF